MSSTFGASDGDLYRKDRKVNQLSQPGHMKMYNMFVRTYSIFFWDELDDSILNTGHMILFGDLIARSKMRRLGRGFIWDHLGLHVGPAGNWYIHVYSYNFIYSYYMLL